MIKKTIAGLVLGASLLFSVSCSDDFNGEIHEGPMGEVTFSLDVEGVLKTRAISDGNGADQLMWAIFDEEGTLILKKAVKDNVAGLASAEGYSFSITLAKGKTYKASFWAQDGDCNAYTVSDDMKVQVNYEGMNNDETRDAFFATTDAFTVDESTVVSVVLKRPFAQVNVGAYPWDLEYAQESGMNIKLSGASIKGVANAINLFDGVVSGEVDVNYSLSEIPVEKLLVDVDGNGKDEQYEYLSMSYILASPESTTHEMSFTFSDAVAEDVPEGDLPEDYIPTETAVASDVFTFAEGLGFVPVQRNWRTNIVGQILTGNMGFNIKIDPVYEGETINSGGLYYNFTEDTVVENKEFAFNDLNSWACFTTENNNLLTMRNVNFYGKIDQIAIGDYRGKGKEDVPYTNVLENVVAENMVVGNSIANVNTIDYMSLLLYIRGESKIKNCTFTGTTSTAEPVVDYNGVTHDVMVYDCGIPNFCVAEFDGCTISNLYAWSHSQITLKNSKVGYIRCSTHKKSYELSHLTIDAGTVVDEIVVSSSGVQKFVTIDGVKTLTADPWSPSLIIKAGAVVKKLDYNGRPIEDVIIEEGAQVLEAINALVPAE